MSLQFGDVVIVKSKLSRMSEWTGREHWKVWRNRTFKAPRTGILIGFRTLADGKVTYGSIDEPTIFKPITYFRAALVALDAKTRPILVPLIGDYITNEIDMGENTPAHPVK